MKKYKFVALIAFITIFGCSKLEADHSENDVKQVLKQEYGYYEPDYSMEVSLEKEKAIATVSTVKTTGTWKIALNRSSNGWSLTPEQREEDKKELDLFESVGKSIQQQIASGQISPNSEAPREISFLFKFVQIKYPKQFK